MEQFFKLRFCRSFIWTFGKACRQPFHSNTLYYCTAKLDSTFRNITYKDYSPHCGDVNIQVRNYAKRAQGKLLKSGKPKTAQLTDEELADVIDIAEYRTRLQQVTEKLKKDFGEHLSLRSSASSIENILVKIENEEYPLHELAQISKKNPNLIAINMSDFPEGLKPAIQAITESGSGMNPQQEGTMIYLSIPKLSREHRENLAKNAKAIAVKAKEEVRSIQNQYVKEAKSKTDLSEDLIFNATHQIMAVAEQCNAELEKTMKLKQKELLGES
ncbi:Ribosome-recycling factor, mitochondrial, partial [Stegodyphus mimosarum]